MSDKSEFDIKHFLPYLMNQAADALSLEFQKSYKARYGMLRTEWRVLFHLGFYGEMTAKEICDRGRLHKTKVSRAVAKLEARRFLSRTEVETDRRHSRLRLTKQGQKAFEDLSGRARLFNDKVLETLSPEEAQVLTAALSRIAGF